MWIRSSRVEEMDSLLNVELEMGSAFQTLSSLRGRETGLVHIYFYIVFCKIIKVLWSTCRWSTFPIQLLVSIFILVPSYIYIFS